MVIVAVLALQGGGIIVPIMMRRMRDMNDILNELVAQLPSHIVPFVDVAVGSFILSSMKESSSLPMMQNGCISLKEYISTKIEQNESKDIATT